METMRARNQPRPVEYDVENNDALYTVRLPSSARRYRPSQPIQQNIANEPVTEKGTLIQRRRPSSGPKEYQWDRVKCCYVTQDKIATGAPYSCAAGNGDDDLSLW